MKAARWYKAGDIRVEDVPECQIDEDYDVKVKLHWCGICGSDLHEYLMGPIFIPVGEPHPVTGEAAPVIMGHEFSGEVVDSLARIAHGAKVRGVCSASSRSVRSFAVPLTLRHSYHCV